VRALNLIAFAAVVLLSGCSLPQPFRVTGPDPELDCTADANWRVPPACADAVLERSRDYDLLFVEFSDQGLQYPLETFGESAAYQINHALTRLEQLIAQPGNGLSLVVYVHGWKHNSWSDDEDVREFRSQLAAAAAFEAARPPQERLRVVGIYVGWRGLSSMIQPFRELSFWTRKTAALHVALGSSRELFARLRSFRCRHASVSATGDCEPSSREGGRQVRMVMMGHSFGGLILFNAISGAITERLTTSTGRDERTLPPWSYGDMVVLINPAFEATRYAPLHRIATADRHDAYQSPLFLAVTTEADLATRVFFPLGRYLNAVFQRHASDEERLGNRRTPGHMAAYITHTLTRVAEEPCSGWHDPVAVQGPDRTEQVGRIADIEIAHALAFHEDVGKLQANWTRTLCGGALLRHHQHDHRTSIWNVRTDGSVMSGHSDISNPTLSAFLRQLYRESAGMRQEP
jgi:hypothetical protein